MVRSKDNVILNATTHKLRFPKYDDFDDPLAMAPPFSSSFRPFVPWKRRRYD
jgi:hypothetical protein